MARRDPHSYADDTQPSVSHFAWRARIDFERRVLLGEVTLHLRDPHPGPLDLDTRDLTIENVCAGTDGRGAQLSHALDSADPVLGSRLRIELPAGVAAVTIAYRTSPGASALQWLQPSQTAGGHAPYLYSQCQALHARSVVPLQDTPRVRVCYQAELTAPRGLQVLMAAESLGREERGDAAVTRFRMEQPIPPYLLALAAGDLASRELGPRSRVWAEPSVVEAAAREFGGVDAMLLAAEKLLGPYDWERFDLLVLPPAFPYGGMENPRLTFLTPTLITGDRSLVSVVAHELAHSWTGNLVSNASAEDFWLNEGFTVFAERKILEALEGKEIATLHAALGWCSLQEALADFKDRPQLTRLRTQLAGIDPDAVFSTVPYEKGFLFLRALEEAAGPGRFDTFLRRYTARFRFSSITTQDFLDFAKGELPGILEQVAAPAWIDGEGIPPNAPIPRSSRLEAVQRLGQAVVTAETARTWSPVEWQVYLSQLRPPLAAASLASLERDYHLGAHPNPEIRVAWLGLAIRSGHAPAVEQADAFLGQVGRGKYLRPLYAALASRPETKPRARACLEKYRGSYHSIAVGQLEALVA